VKNWERAADGRRMAGTPKLINLRDDPTETRDRSTDEPARFAALTRKWEAWNAQLAVPFNGEARARDQEKAPKKSKKRPERETK
jgi:hypothetical protein